jgi:hypothetical protein
VGALIFSWTVGAAAGAFAAFSFTGAVSWARTAVVEIIVRRHRVQVSGRIIAGLLGVCFMGVEEMVSRFYLRPYTCRRRDV